MNKYRRTYFQEDVQVYGSLEKDLVSNHWDLFKTKKDIGYFTIKHQHIQRPDLVSIEIYGDQQYWWILGKFNKIDDWWNDVYVGQIINYPSLIDVEDWFINVKRAKLNG
jgi:hypothetical protein